MKEETQGAQHRRAYLASHPLVLTRSDEVLHDAVANYGVGHDLIPRGQRLLKGVANGTTIGSTAVIFIRHGAPVDVEAYATGSRIVISASLAPVEVRIGADSALESSWFALSNGRETVIREPRAGSFILAFDRDLIDHTITRLTGAMHAPVEFGPRWTRAALGRGMISATLRHVESTLAANPVPPPLAARMLESMLVDALLLAMPHSHSSLFLAQREAGSGHAERAKAWLEEHLGEPVSIADLSVAVNLSTRQLQAVVRDRFGYGPVRLLRELRLERAHTLLRSGAATSVSEAALESGFTHLGRFAAAYRERYGVLPSTELEAG
ncbi:MAG: helix-turn-helix transcriptional regulator [Actinobacteria bacterium]|nr:helix-turn-helix transcriptional regulator [Actinomycetota bacterium]